MNRWCQGVVAGVDGSEEGYRALDWAQAAADRHEARLTVLGTYVVPVATYTGPVLTSGTVHAAADRAVVRALVRLDGARPGGRDVATEVVPGAAAHLLVQRSRTSDLVVVGRRGLGAVERLFAGSVSSALAAMANGPVAVVPASASPRPPRRVVAGVATDAYPGPLLETAFDEAAALGVPLEVVHAVDPGPLASDLALTEGWGTPWRATALAAVRDDVQRWAEKYPEVPCRVTVVDGSPADALVRDLHPDDLVVVGGRSHRRIAGRVLGSVADKLLRTAPCAVVVAHAQHGR